MLTLNEVPEVAQLLATILTSEPVTHCALAVIPLLAPNLDDPDWYARHETDIAAARQTMAAQPGQVGVLTYVANRWVGLDLLAGTGLFARVWPRLCAGYVADAIGREPKPWQRLEPGPCSKR